MESRGIKLHEPNRRDIDNTSFDRFEVIDGSTKSEIYHSEQGKRVWIKMGEWGSDTCVRGTRRLKNNMTDIHPLVSDKGA